MDALEKSLRKLTAKERKLVKDVLFKLSANNLQGLDLKKLRGAEDIFRARKGALRIIYRKEGSKLFILAIERRQENTHKDI
ncbi:MAG: type II toxin-antitoxin system RelE/ParE family toxin [Candidatus Colwellbacteria bacterium]|nr:type II toxin-antitoxin system RelE/ParE family toxin [Candidatus Colwellbacteria bacterium]